MAKWEMTAITLVVWDYISPPRKATVDPLKRIQKFDLRLPTDSYSICWFTTTIPTRANLERPTGKIPREFSKELEILDERLCWLGR